MYISALNLKPCNSTIVINWSYEVLYWIWWYQCLMCYTMYCVKLKLCMLYFFKTKLGVQSIRGCIFCLNPNSKEFQKPYISIKVITFPKNPTVKELGFLVFEIWSSDRFQPKQFSKIFGESYDQYIQEWMWLVIMLFTYHKKKAKTLSPENSQLFCCMKHKIYLNYNS